MSSQFLVDGVPLPAPAEVRVSWQEVSESRRALDGTLHVDHRGRRRVVELRWPLLAPDDMAQIEGVTTPWRLVQLTWTEPSGVVTVSAVPRPGARALVAGRSIWDASAGRWMWADVALALEEV